MPNRAYGAIVDGTYILMIRRSICDPTVSWSLPGGECLPGEDFDVSIARHALAQTGLAVETHRWLYEDRSDPDGSTENCFLLMLSSGAMPERESNPENDGIRWMTIPECTDARVRRIAPVLDYEGGWPTALPFNWASVRDKDRELMHRFRRASRYLARPPWNDHDDSLLGQALISIQEHIPRDPLAVWDFIQRWGRHPAQSVRGRIGVYLLEDLIRDHFDLIFPKIRTLAQRDPLFADCVMSCWIVGQAKRPANRRKMVSLRKMIMENRTWRTLCAASVSEECYATITPAPEPRPLDPLPPELEEAIRKLDMTEP